MDARVEAKPTIRDKVLHELKEFAALTLYLYVCFAALIYFKASILESENIHPALLGVAIVKAAISAKFIMIGHAINLGDRFKNHPLIVPTLFKSFAFLALLLLLTVIEEIVVGLIHGKTVAASLGEIAGGTLSQITATCAVMMLILVPYFAFRTLGELVGDRNLVRLFFTGRRTMH